MSQYVSTDPPLYTTDLGQPGGVAQLDGNGVIVSTQLTGVVTAAAIEDGSITGVKLAAATVAAVNLAPAAVDLSTSVATGTLAATKGGTGHASYAQGDLLVASSTTALARLAAPGGALPLVSATGGAAPAYASLTAAGLAADAVTTVKILDGSVSTPKLADASVTGPKIAAAAVTASALATGAVDLSTGVVTGTLPVANLPLAVAPASGASTLWSSADVKAYADGIAAGVKYHQPAAVMSTGALSATYSAAGAHNGSYTFAADPSPYDGVALAVGTRILVKDQVDAKQNGIYQVATTLTWQRADDFDNTNEQSEVTVGDTVYVIGGTGAGRTYSVTGTAGGTPLAAPAINLNVDDVLWGLISAMPTNLTGFSVAGGNLLTLTTTANTNVTLPTSGTLATTDAASLTTGTLAQARLPVVDVAHGGTSYSTYAVGDLLYADTTTTLAKLADVAAGNVLLSGGVSVAPAWGKVALASAVSGVLPPLNGGTGASLTLTAGDLLVASNSTSFARLPAVATGNALVSAGAGAAPVWGKVALANTVSGVLPAANGGTGNDTYVLGDLLYADTATTLTRLADVAVGNVLLSGGVGAAPAWGKVALASAVSGILPATSGGTGSNLTYAVGDLLVANATTTLTNLAAPGGALPLVSTTAGVAPAYAALTAAGLAADAVTTAKILDANVTAAKLAPRTVYEMFSPAYPNGGFVGGGAITLGTVTVGGVPYNWYSKTGGGASTLTTRWIVPQDFISWVANPITIEYQNTTASASNNVTVSMWTGSTSVTGTGLGTALSEAVSTSVVTFTVGAATAPYFTAGSFTPGTAVFLQLSVVRASGTVRVGSIRFNYSSQ